METNTEYVLQFVCYHCIIEGVRSDCTHETVQLDADRLGRLVPNGTHVDGTVLTVNQWFNISLPIVNFYTLQNGNAAALNIMVLLRWKSSCRQHKSARPIWLCQTDIR